MATKTQIGFGDKARLSQAIADGALDEFDLVCLNDSGEMGWIDEDKAVHLATSRTTEDITINGVTGLGKEDQSVIPAGSSLDEIIKMLVQKQIHPTYTAPKIAFSKVTLTDTNFEAGTTLNINTKTTYTQNDGGAVTEVKVYKNNTAVDTGTSCPHTYTEEVVIGDETLTYKSTVSYADGAVKQDNFGADDDYGQIKAGTLTSGNLTYVGKRYEFYGVLTEAKTEFTSDDVRALSGKTFGTSFTINVPVGAQTIVFAMPSTIADPTVKYEETNDSGMLGKFTKSTIQVADARGGENGLKSYKLFVYAMATPAAATMTISVN